jgi:hypothetical protein
MARQSGLLKRMAQNQKAREGEVIRFAIQRVADCAVIALHDQFGFGPERNKKFMEALSGVLGEMADIVIADEKCDKELVYSQTKFDNAVKEALGEHFVPWNERYN